MIQFAEYADTFENIKFDRSDGILQMTLHTDGDSLRWGPGVSQLQEAFDRIGVDPDNRVLILTGAGEEFNGPKGSPETFPGATARGWEFAHWNVRRLLRNLLDLEMPVISAINGPIWRHCETPLLSDVVIASDTTVIQDSGHFRNGLVPGDGMHLVLPIVMGPTRARYFMITGQELDAWQARDYGIVNEVVPRDQVLPRAWEIARELIEQSPLALRYTRLCFTHVIRQIITANQGYGVMLEGMAAIDDQTRAGYTIEPRF